MKTTAERMKGIIAAHLNVAEDRVTPEANFIDDLNADSIDHVELVMAFEEEFGIELSDDETEGVKTVGDAIKLVERKAGVMAGAAAQ